MCGVHRLTSGKLFTLRSCKQLARTGYWWRSWRPSDSVGASPGDRHAQHALGKAEPAAESQGETCFRLVGIYFPFVSFLGDL